MKKLFKGLGGAWSIIPITLLILAEFVKFTISDEKSLV